MADYITSDFVKKVAQEMAGHTLKNENTNACDTYQIAVANTVPINVNGDYTSDDAQLRTAAIHKMIAEKAGLSIECLTFDPFGHGDPFEMPTYLYGLPQPLDYNAADSIAKRLQTAAIEVAAMGPAELMAFTAKVEATYAADKNAYKITKEADAADKAAKDALEKAAKAHEIEKKPLLSPRYYTTQPTTPIQYDGEHMEIKSPTQPALQTGDLPPRK